MDIDPNAPCRELTVAQQQVVEIAKALALDARILVLDEPSATLTSQEVARLFAVLRAPNLLNHHGHEGSRRKLEAFLGCGLAFTNEYN